MNNLYSVQDNIVFLTGANGQLGRASAKILKELGAKVIGGDVQEKSENKNLKDYIQVDITISEQVNRAIESTFKKYGRIDCLINNAGVSTFENFEDRSEENFDWVMDVNLKGTFFCIQNFVKHFDLAKLKSGRIINIASFYGVISPDPRIYIDLPRKNSEVYGATKAGIIQMTKYFAVHLAERNINVNCISPGGIFNAENPQGPEFQKAFAYRCPQKRMAKQEEIVSALPYLMSPASSYVNGVNLVIDGGMSCW